jgi:hypothetical protein
MRGINMQLDWKRKKTEKLTSNFSNRRDGKQKSVDLTSSNCAINKEVITSHIWCTIGERKNFSFVG